MAVAATSELLVKIVGQSNLSGVVAKDEAALGRFNTAAKTSGSHVNALVGASSKASAAMVGFGGALTHASGKIGGLLSGPLGLIGLTSGILSFGAVITGSVRKIQDFGLGLEKIQGLTGETALSAGILIQLFDKYGLGIDRVSQIAGFAEKTLGKLNSTTAASGKAAKSAELQNLELVKAQRQAAGESTKAIDKLIKEQKGRDAVAALQQKTAASVTKLAALDKQYGLQLIDSRGKVVSFSQVLEQLANLYDRKNVPASTKAYVASQVLGRGYAALIPILTNGSAAIAEASKEARALGLDQAGTAEQIVHFRDVMRNLGEAVDIVQMRIGLALVPAITDAANSFGDWLDNGGADQIVQFFRSGAKFAGEMGHAIETFIVPAFKAIAAAWGAVPGPLKDLLIGGFVANKVGNFLFDKSLFQGGKNILGSLLGRVPVVGGAVAGVTGAGGTPVFVTNWPAGFGLGPGSAAADVVTTAGKAGLLAAVLPIAVTALGSAAVITAIQNLAHQELINGQREGTPQINLSGSARYGGAFPIVPFHGPVPIPADQRNPDRFDRAMFDAVKAGAEAGVKSGLVHSTVFQKAQAVREAGGFALSRDALISMLHSKQPLGVDALVTGQAIALAVGNHLRTDQNPDLKSAANNLALLKRLQSALPEDLASQLAPKIHSLEAAIDRTTAAIKAKQFVQITQNVREGSGGGVDRSSVVKVLASQNIRERAGGGSVLRGLGYLVGENGPELFTPTHSGKITPRRQNDANPIQSILDWFFGTKAEQGIQRAAMWDPLSGVSKGDWAMGHRTSEADLRRMAGGRHLTLHANVSMSTREVNTAQSIRLRHGPTPTQVGAM